MKSVLALSFLCVLFQQTYALTDQEVLRGIVGSHTRALDNANMYAKPLDDHYLQEWELAILQVKIFIGFNSKKNRKYLLNCFNDVKRANDNLITGIKKIYVAKSDNGSLSESTRVMFRTDLTKIFHQAKLVQKSLDWIHPASDSEAKAIKLLTALAMTVKATAAKAIVDLGFANPNQREKTNWISTQ